jgi:hypothetical protein
MNESGMLANGSGAAAVLAAAVGCLALGILALAADAFAPVAQMLNVWNPTGPLSGVTDAAILVWLAGWFILSRTWSGKTVDMRRVNAAAAVMIVGGLLLTFPPLMDLLQGK